MSDSESNDLVIVLGSKVRGRPKAQEPGSAVMTWVPQSVHDRLIRQAAKREESVSSLVRFILTQKVK